MFFETFLAECHQVLCLVAKNEVPELYKTLIFTHFGGILGCFFDAVSKMRKNVDFSLILVKKMFFWELWGGGFGG